MQVNCKINENLLKKRCLSLVSLFNFYGSWLASIKETSWLGVFEHTWISFDDQVVNRSIPLSIHAH